MKRNFYALLFLPAALGFVAWLAFRFGWFPDSILYLRANLGFLIFLFGFLLSTLIGIGLAFYDSFESRARKEVDKVLNDSSAQHRQFLQRLDHELKNPLTALQVELANLSEDESNQTQPKPAPVSSMSPPLERIREQVSRLNDMVFQLRKLADLQINQIEHEPVKLEELLDDLVAEFSTKKPNITLNIARLPWPLPEVKGDPDLLYLAFRNVLANAVKFTESDEAIQIRAFEDTSHIVLEVADEGLGIPPDEIPHITEELYRGKNARGLPGSGLGLALVRAIVERHGGQVTIRSRVDQGTVVVLRLPRM